MEIVEGTATIEDVDAFVSQLSEIGETYGATVQAFDARYIVDREHLAWAVELAIRAIDRGEAVARDPAVEILLYAAGRRQIDQAMEIGVSAGTCPVVAVAVGGRAGEASAAVAELLEPADTLGDYEGDRVRSFFDVSDRELDATDGELPDIVRERVTLLVVER